MRRALAADSPDRPPLTLALGPAGAGKTEWAIARFLEAGGRAMLVVSSPEQAETYAAQIAERAEQSVDDIRCAVHSFRSLLAALGKSAPDDDRRTIGRAFQRLALAELLPRNLREDDFLGRMRHTPGFVGALADRIREWKLAGITPDGLESGALLAAEHLDDPVFSLKAQELARLFRAYETFLTQNRLQDEEDLLRRAAEIVADETAPLPFRANLLLVDGFYRFNHTQRRLLAAFAGRGLAMGKPEFEVALTLPYAAHRPLLFAAPERTLHILRTEFTTREALLTPPPNLRPPTLALLEARLFEGVECRVSGVGEQKAEGVKGRRGERVKGENPTPQSPNYPITQLPDTQRPTPERPNALSIFDAPNPYVEAEMVARAFRQMYDSGGYHWSDFAVILRTMGDYAPILSAVFERYGIPLGVDGPETLAENPLLKTLLHFFAVVRRGWQREDVIAFLKSGYTAPSKLAADGLRRRAQATGVREGRERWLALIGEDMGETNLVAATLHEMAQWEAALLQGRDTPKGFATQIQEMVTAFGLAERILTGDPVRQKRDHAALKAAYEVMDAIAIMGEFAGRARVSFAEFQESLVEAWRNVQAIAPMEGDFVRVVEPYDARERPLRVAAVMGLMERVFPRRITEDPFLRDEERAALRERANLDLEAQKGRADDERFFFYLAVTAPSERLFLSFPRSSDEADTLPSFYLDEVRAVFEGIEGVGCRVSGVGENPIQGVGEKQGQGENPIPNTQHSTPNYPTPDTRHPTPIVVSRTLADVAPQPEEVVTEADRLLAACAGLFDPGADSDPTEQSRRLRAAAALMQGCLQQESPTYDSPTPNAQRPTPSHPSCDVRAIVASRYLPRLPRLESADLRADFAGQKPVYSVSELETYRRCPFQYLLRHVLRLRPEENGANPRAQGTLLHAVLRRYFRRRQTEGVKGRRGEGEEQGTGESPITQLPNYPTTQLPNAQRPTPDSMCAELHGLLAETLQSHNLDASPHYLRMTERMLSDALVGFAEREQQFGTLFGMRPTHFELAFGMGQAGLALIEDEEREGIDPDAVGIGNGETISSSPHFPISPTPDTRHPTPYTLLPVLDPASCLEPLLIKASDGGPPVAVCGTIDRVDCDPTGRRALVMDYKLNKSVEYSAMQRGDSLQMPLYLMAIERLFGMSGAVACYDAMQERGRRRIFRSEHVNIRQFAPVTPLESGDTVKPLNRDQYADLIKTAEATTVQAARSIESGRIEATPGDHCAACAYNDVCRMTLLGSHDGELIPLTERTVPPKNPD